jgi:ribosome-associated protein
MSEIVSATVESLRMAGGDIKSCAGHPPKRLGSPPRACYPERVRITETLDIDDREIQERFVRSSGPGGQNVNKVATAVELRFDVGASSLPDDVKARLITLAGTRMTTEGVLLIDSREHRTQTQNREAARIRLADLVRKAARPPRPRRATKPKAAAREKRLETKKRRSTIKARRGRTSTDD